MAEMTTRLGLPLLQAGQARKEVLHNEALVLLDALTAGLVEAVGRNVPPSDPLPGQVWIIGTAPSGEWTGQGEAVAVWTEGGWRFVPPADGLSLRLRGSGLPVDRRMGAWSDGELVATGLTVAGQQVVGARRPGIAEPAGGATIDPEARMVLGAILVALRSHGLIEV